MLYLIAGGVSYKVHDTVDDFNAQAFSAEEFDAEPAEIIESFREYLLDRPLDLK